VGDRPDLLQTLCPHPDYKLLMVQSIPQMADTHRDFANYHWPSLLKTSRQMLTTGWPCQEGLNWRKPSGVRPTVECNTAIANVLTLRGSAIADAPVADFPPDDFYVEWSPVHSRCRGSPFRLVGHDKVRCCTHQSIVIILQIAQQSIDVSPPQRVQSATVVSNSSRVWKPIEHCTSRAWGTFASRAFLHQYEKYGTTEDDFVDAFVQAERLIKSYRELR
jgi:tubulin delta